MNSLDITGSFIIGGIVLFTLMAIFFRFTTSSQSAIINEFTQSSVTNVAQIIDYDFSKIGYRVAAANKITSFDSSSISFLADLNNDGTTDSVSYFTRTVGGYLKLVRRTSLTTPAEWEVTIDDFDIQAFDSLGAATIAVPTIRSVQVGLLLNNDIFTTDSTEIIGAYWEKRYNIRNF